MSAASTDAPDQPRGAYQILPAPASYTEVPDEAYQVTGATHIVVDDDEPDVTALAERFATWLRRATGFDLPVGSEHGEGDIELSLDPSGGLGDEGYTLRTYSGGARIEAGTREGLFRGLTTLRLMLPTTAEYHDVLEMPWTVGAAEITDRPRFEYRGAMLDVARHFFHVADVLRFIDLISLYKINHLHLHLTDDQGWRLTVPSRPRLTEVGGPTDIDGGPGGFYTEDEFALIVGYAAERFVEVVPEIDVPGHTTTALRAYPELSCDGVAPQPREEGGIASVSLCVGKPETTDFLVDVFDSVVAQSPGTYVHIGADEAVSTTHDHFLAFVPEAAGLVVERGRRVIAWHEAAAAELPAGSVVQYWGRGEPETTGLARDAVARGLDVILSPANHAYLDMKYHFYSPYGLSWAGFVTVSQAYDWDPATLIDGVPEESILGVEAPLWSETTPDRSAMEYLVFPRLIGVAEIGWSRAATLDWDEHRLRLAAQGPRLDLLAVNYYRTTEVPWPE